MGHPTLPFPWTGCSEAQFFQGMGLNKEDLCPNLFLNTGHGWTLCMKTDLSHSVKGN